MPAIGIVENTLLDLATSDEHVHQEVDALSVTSQTIPNKPAFGELKLRS